MDEDPGLDRAEAQMLLASTPERVSDLLGGIDNDRARYRHGPAFPSLAEVAAHLAAAAGTADSLVRAVSAGAAEVDVRAALDPAGPEEEPPALKESLGLFRSRRAATVEALRATPEAEWQRPVPDRWLGEVSLLDACRLLVGHELGHLAQLRNLISLVPEPEDLGPAKGARLARERSSDPA